MNKENTATPALDNGAQVPPPTPQAALLLDGAEAGALTEGLDPSANPQGTGAPVPVERPWKPIIEGGIGTLKERLTGWKWNPAAIELIALGLERRLDKLCPGGLEGMDAWGPEGLMFAGAALLVLDNLEFGHRPDGRFFIRLKPPIPPAIEGETAKPDEKAA